MSDDYDAACAQQEQDERRRREDEALARHGVLLAQSRRDQAQFEREGREFYKRIFNHGSGRQ